MERYFFTLGSSTTLLFKSQGCVPRTSEMNQKKGHVLTVHVLVKQMDISEFHLMLSLYLIPSGKSIVLMSYIY